jgi:hypothetical protein
MPAAEEYRRYAALCIALAQNMRSEQDKARLLQMAQAWRDLADKLLDRPDEETSA